jgi:phenylacetate-CoA ligase
MRQKMLDMKAALKRHRDNLYLLVPGNFFWSRGAWRYYRFLMKSQWWSLEELRRYQMQKLSELLEFAYSYVPYYRDFFNEKKIHPRDIQSLDQLEIFPIIDKTFVNDNYQQFVPEYDFKKLLPARTSGSSGENLAFKYTPDYLDIKNAANYRSYKWAGKNWSDWVCALKAPRGDSRAPIQFKRDIRSKTWRIDTAHLDDASIDRIIDIINELGPAVVTGYPSIMYLIARVMRDKRKAFHKKPKAIFTVGEIFPDDMRNFIEEVIGTQTYDWYGVTEGCASAAQCEHGGYHLNAEYCHVETIEKDNLSRIVGTNLVNWAFPIIRYDTGDLGELKEGRCPCGRGLPLMKPIAGRNTNFIYTSSGRKFFWADFFSQIHDTPIREYQIIQEEIDAIDLLYVPKPSFGRSDLEGMIINLKRALGEQVTVNAKVVEKVERSPEGKYQVVVSKINRN